MNANEYMQATERNLVHTYNRFPVTLDRGEGVYLYDIWILLRELQCPDWGMGIGS